MPVLFSLVLVAWQWNFTAASHESRRPFAMAASMGLGHDLLRFFYFFHHFGVYPVGALEVPELGASKAEAERFVARHGDRLRMDFGWAVNSPRFGDHGKLFLFFPDLWLRGDPAHPSAILFDELLFILALLALFWAFWREGHGGLGVALVVLVGSDPFQVLETYARGNIFSLPISVTLLSLAAHLRFLTRRAGVDRLAWVIAVASGVVLASFREVRAEASVVTISVLASYLVARAPLGRRLLLAGVFVLAFALTGQAWARYWNGQFARAERFVARAGGEVFRAPGGLHHTFWHAVYCGLGDYGTDRGFTWDDRDAFRWATTRDPVSNPHPLPYTYVDGYYLQETYDGVHRIAPTDLPAYNALVRRRVLGEIGAHPLWYIRILFARIVAIQRDATPAAISVGSSTWAVPGAGWLTLPVLLLALWRRSMFHVMLIAFLLPLSAAALLVYSAKGMTFYGLAHLAALVAGADLVRGLRSPVPTKGVPHVA